MRNPWTLLEVGFIGYPDDTGMKQKFAPQIKGQDYPYDEELPDGDYTEIGSVKGQGHNCPTPMDTDHTAWADESVSISEVEGSPILIGKSSPGGMTGVIPGGHKFGGNPFDREVPDDDVERASHEDVPYNIESRDSELEDSLDGETFDGGSELPSDIMTVATDGFTTGLGGAMKISRNLFGIRDHAGEITARSAWKFLESLVSITKR